MDTPAFYDEHKFGQELKDILENNNLPEAAGKIKDYMEELDKVTLNVAIIGESGAGKSTFVNAFRGLGDEEEGSALTGPVQTTMEPVAYPHPHFPNAQLWDLPGVGTPDFKAEDYLKQIEFDRFDFFIIISSERFKENDVKLAKEIVKQGKKFYFVRSKIDSSLNSEKRKKSFKEKETLQKIRKHCIQELEKNGAESPTVFLISSFHLGKYDFPELVNTFEKELPSHKRHALLLALPNLTQEILKKKKAAFEANIWKVALMSGLVGAVPIPCLSIAVDVTIILAETLRYTKAFGIDSKSLKNLVNRTGVPFQELTAELKSTLNINLSSDVILFKLMTTQPLAMMAEESLRWLPIIGSILASQLSFAITYAVLKSCLEELADDAQRVLIKVLNTDQKMA